MKARKGARAWLLVLLPVLQMLAGCDELKITPVPLEGTALPGNWYGERETQLGNIVAYDRLFMQVSEEGYVSYFYLACESGHEDGRVRMKRFNLHNVPIKRLTTVKMVLQSYPLTPKFEISLGAWPDTNEGVWVVDDIELQPVEARSPLTMPDPGLWECQAPSAQ